MEVLIREARPGEFAAAGDLVGDAYRRDGLLGLADGSVDGDYESQLRNAARRADEAVLLVAVDDDQVVGTVTWCPPGSGWREVAVDDQGEFRMLAVADDYRGRGLGRELVRCCIARAAGLGLSELVLSTRPEMRAAHRVYQQLGFVRAPELDHTPKPGVNLWSYRLVLPAASATG